MKLKHLNEYTFWDKDGDEVKVGDTILFQHDGIGKKDSWVKGIIDNINGKKITVINFEAKTGEPDKILVKDWKKIDIVK